MKGFFDKYIHYNIPFYILTGIAIVLLIVSFLLPPQGTIDPSVLQAAGEIFAFASLWTVLVAIESGGTAKIKHHDTEVELQSTEKGEN